MCRKVITYLYKFEQNSKLGPYLYENSGFIVGCDVKEKPKYQITPKTSKFWS